MELMDELRWSLDDMLEKAKKNPMPICYDYDTRFRIWTKQILRGRLNKIIETGGNAEYIERMINLVLDDYDRLVERSRKEYHMDFNMKIYQTRNYELFTITKTTIKLYEDQKHD